MLLLSQRFHKATLQGSSKCDSDALAASWWEPKTAGRLFSPSTSVSQDSHLAFLTRYPMFYRRILHADLNVIGPSPVPTEFFQSAAALQALQLHFIDTRTPLLASFFTALKASNAPLRSFFLWTKGVFGNSAAKFIEFLPNRLEALSLVPATREENPKLIKAVVRYLTNLTTLSIDTYNIPDLKQLTSLRNLSVRQWKDTWSTREGCTLLLASLPPSLGYHITFSNGPDWSFTLQVHVWSLPETILHRIAPLEPGWVNSLLASGQLDLSRPYFATKSLQRQDTLLLSALQKSTNLSMVPLLLDHGANPLDIGSRYFDCGLPRPCRQVVSIFHYLLFSHEDISNWNGLAEYVFVTSRWFKEHLAACKGNVKKALGLRNDPARPWTTSVLHYLLHRHHVDDPFLFTQRAEFVVANFALFGCTWADLNANGCNLSHCLRSYSETLDSCEGLWDRLQLDNAGRSTAECLAYHGASLPLTAIAGAPITSPLIWGALGAFPSRKFERFESLLIDLLDSSVLEATKQQCITTCVNVQLRVFGIHTVEQLFAKSAETKRMTIVALREPFDSESYKRNFAGIAQSDPEAFAEFDLPTPHVLALLEFKYFRLQNVKAFLAGLATALGGQKVLDQWFDSTLDRNGNTPKQLVAKYKSANRPF